MKKIYQEPLLEVVKLQTMQMLAVSVKDEVVTEFDDLLAPEMQELEEDDYNPFEDDMTEY